MPDAIMDNVDDDDSVPLVVGVRVLPPDLVHGVSYVEDEGGCLHVDQTTNEVVFNQERTFQYDCVYSERTKQDSIYQSSLEPFLSTLLDGYSVTALVYGAKATGKSYTLYGPDLGPALNEQEFGLIPRFLRGLYQTLTQTCVKFKVTLSSFDIYNSDIVDLLADSNTSDHQLNIKVDEFGRACVENVSEVECDNVSEALSCLNLGLAYHNTKLTNVPELRNLPGQIHENVHSVVKVNLQQFLFKDGVLVCKDSCIQFVECAASDQVYSASNDSAGRIPSLVNQYSPMAVNRGILTLNNVISALGDHRRNVSHVPFQDSLLTQLLSAALGGNSVTFLLATLSPSMKHQEATLSTLMFSSFAANICTKPVPVIYPVQQTIEPLPVITNPNPAYTMDHMTFSPSINQPHNNPLFPLSSKTVNMTNNSPANHHIAQMASHPPVHEAGQMTRHLPVNKPRYMSSHPPHIQHQGISIPFVQYTSYPNNFNSPSNNPYITTQNLQYQAELRAYMEAMADNNVELDYILNKNVAMLQQKSGYVASNTPSFTSHSSRANAPWHSTPDGRGYHHQEGGLNNQQPTQFIHSPTSDCTSILEEVSPLPYQPSLGVNMYLNNYPTADHNKHQLTNNGSSSHHQPPAAAAEQQLINNGPSSQHQQLAAALDEPQALTTTLQQASSSKQIIMNMYQQELLTATSSFSGDKCDSSLMESMSLPPGADSIHFGEDSTLGELAQYYQQQVPMLGNQGHIILGDGEREQRRCELMMTAPLPAAHHIIQESRRRDELLYQQQFLQRQLNPVEPGIITTQQQSEIARVTNNAETRTYDKWMDSQTHQGRPDQIIDPPMKLADLEKLSKILEESEVDSESIKSSKFSSSRRSSSHRPASSSRRSSSDRSASSRSSSNRSSSLSDSCPSSGDSDCFNSMDSTISRELITLSLKQTSLNKSLKSSITKSVKNLSCDKAVVEHKSKSISIEESFTAEVNDGLVNDNAFHQQQQILQIQQQKLKQQHDIEQEKQIILLQQQKQDQLQHQQILQQQKLQQQNIEQEQQIFLPQQTEDQQQILHHQQQARNHQLQQTQYQQHQQQTQDQQQYEDIIAQQLILKQQQYNDEIALKYNDKAVQQHSDNIVKLQQQLQQQYQVLQQQYYDDKSQQQQMLQQQNSDIINKQQIMLQTNIAQENKSVKHQQQDVAQLQQQNIDDEGTDYEVEAMIRGEVYSSQDFNSECSDISQLDLKLEYAQDQLRIQNHHLFNQYLHQLLANNKLGDIINQFEASFVEKADNDTDEVTNAKEEVDVDVSDTDIQLMREQLNTINDLVEKTKTRLEDHKDLLRGKQSLLKEMRKTRSNAGDLVSRLTSQVEKLGKETRRAQHHLLTNQIDLAKLENLEASNKGYPISAEEKRKKIELTKNVDKYSENLRYFENKSREVETTLSLVNPGAKSFNNLEQSIENLDAEYKLIKLKYKDHKQRKNSLQARLNQASKQQTDNSSKQTNENKSEKDFNSNDASANKVVYSNNQRKDANADEIEVDKDTANNDTKVGPHALKNEHENAPNVENVESFLSNVADHQVLLIPQQIADLRIIRDTFISERLHLEEKLDEYKFLSPDEEKQIVELDESVEAIDAAIDYKNDINRKRAVDYSVPCGNPLLDRLACLEIGEVRSLLHKTFIRVLDLRMEGRKLELHVEEVEDQYNLLGKYTRDLGHSLQRSKLDAERRLVNQQNQNQIKMNQLIANMNSKSNQSNTRDIRKMKKLESEVKLYKDKYENLKQSTEQQDNEIELAGDLEKTLTDTDTHKLRDVRKLVDLSRQNKKSKPRDVKTRDNMESIEMGRLKNRERRTEYYNTYEFTDATSETDTDDLGATSKHTNAGQDDLHKRAVLRPPAGISSQNRAMMNQFQKKFAAMQKKLENVAKPTVTREARKLIIENPLTASHSSDRAARTDKK